MSYPDQPIGGAPSFFEAAILLVIGALFSAYTVAWLLVRDPKPELAHAPAFTQLLEPQLIRPEWTNSASAFERLMSTNLYVVTESNRYVIRCKLDGQLQPLWENDLGRDSIEDLNLMLAVNVDFAVCRLLYDAMHRMTQPTPPTP